VRTNSTYIKVFFVISLILRPALLIFTILGCLVGTADRRGVLNFTYIHINREREIRTGICTSRPEMLPDGRIRLHEKWQWTDGDRSRGESVLIEVE